MNINYYKKYEPIDGKWFIKDELGKGAFGTVFEVERNDYSHAKSAMKIITIPASQNEVRSYCDENFDTDMDMDSAKTYFHGFVEEFTEEFRLMSKLRGNSNIVSMEDYEVKEHEGEIGWDIFIRMELLTPMNKYFNIHKPTQRDVIKLGIDICKALESCKKHSVIHRDIKPSNIFVSDDGNFKLGDFGVARTLEKTSSGLSKKGTYTYMAPEVYKGEEYGSTVDIYSLGIVMYKLLNNNFEPFRTERTHTDGEKSLRRRIKGEPIPYPEKAIEDLAEIVLKACAYNSQDRYQNPLHMRKELEDVLEEYGDSLIVPLADNEKGTDEKTYGIFDNQPTSERKSITDKEETIGIFEHEDDTLTPLDYGDYPDTGTRQRPKKKNKSNAKKIIMIASIIVVIAGGIIAALFGMNYFENRKLANAYGMLNNGDFSNAIAEFDQLIAKDNKNIEAYAGKAMAQISSGDNEGAAGTMRDIANNCDGNSGSGRKDDDPETLPPPTGPGPSQPPIIDVADLLRDEFKWLFTYNIANDKADENEVIFKLIEASGLNAKYNIYTRPAVPTSDTASGTYDKPLKVTLSSSGAGTICYIIGDDEFRLRSTTIYENPIDVKKNNTTTHIRAAVYDELFIPSELLDISIELKRSALTAPTYSHNSGNYTSKFSLSFSNPNDDGKIYYTTNGSEPTSESKQYSGKISIGEGTTNIKAKVIDSENDVSSETVSLSYTVTIPQQVGPTCPACGSTNTAKNSEGLYHCYDCGETEPDIDDFGCPECGSSNLTIAGNYNTGQHSMCLDCGNKWNYGKVRVTD